MIANYTICEPRKTHLIPTLYDETKKRIMNRGQQITTVAVCVCACVIICMYFISRQYIILFLFVFSNLFSLNRSVY